MELCWSLALLVGSLGLMFCLIALSTDFWFEAVGPTHSAHSGLWPTGHGDIISGHGPLVSTTAAFAAGKDSGLDWGIGSQRIPAEELSHLSCPCPQPSPWRWPWRCTPASGGTSLHTPRSRPSSPGPSTWAGSQLSSCSVQVP
ncbi:NKG7 isoform 1 [Pan troglodytes]|uniref:NKG7 isoform 1 n=1 Tax=Pan troglodytes TaxID=9598 RepID=A0A2J8Q6Q5_PANTR|nr:NKG7 isoform 1 [Pan troglodytes]